MKKMSKVIAVCLSAIILAGLFAACGGSYNFTSDQAVDNSATQQRWLKYPGSSMVMNPSAISGTDSSDTLKQELAIGVGDKTVPNVLFTLESKWANGIGGNIFWSADFSPETTSFTNMDNLSGNNSKNDSSMDYVVPGDINGNELSPTMPYSIAGRRGVQTYDFVNKDYYLVVESGESEDNVDIHFYTYGPVREPLAASVGSNQTVVVKLNDVCARTDEALITESTMAYFDIRFKKGGAYQFKSFAVKELPAGTQVASSADLSWAPYSMKNTAVFPNGTGVEAEDFYFSTDVITRQLTVNASGEFTVGGEIADGATCVYSEKDGSILVDGANGVNYAVKLGVKDSVKFYASEADMLSGNNALESTSGAKFWVSEVSNIAVGDKVYFAVAASSDSNAEALSEIAKNGTSQSRTKKRLENLPSEWDEYITSHGDVPDYIVNIPQK